MVVNSSITLRLKAKQLKTIYDYIIMTIDGLHMTSSKSQLCKLRAICSKFNMICKMSYHASLSNFQESGSVVEELSAKEVETFSIVSYGKISWRAFACPPTWLPPYKPIQIFQSLGAHNFDVVKCINIRFQDDIYNGVFYLL